MVDYFYSSYTSFCEPSPVEGSATPSLPVRDLTAYPNPFNSGTTFQFFLERSGGVRLEIFDLAGRRLWHSVEVETPRGQMHVAWDARDLAGRNLPSGTYFCRVIHDGAIAAGVRLILIK